MQAISVTGNIPFSKLSPNKCKPEYISYELLRHICSHTARYKSLELCF